MRILKHCSLAFSVCFGMLFLCNTTHAQDNNDNRMLISGQGWYGYDLEQLRPQQASSCYMTYELALGFQTEPADSNLYDKLFGYPTLYAGFSVARMGGFQFHDNLYGICWCRRICQVSSWQKMGNRRRLIFPPLLQRPIETA